MPHAHRIGPAARSTPGATGRPSTASCTLPPDLLREASRRLGIMSLLGAVLWLLGTVLGHIAESAMSNGRIAWYSFGGTDGIAVVSVVVSLGLFAYARRSNRPPEFILDLGLVYLVLTAFNIGLMFHWKGAPHDMAVQPEISWIGAIVLVFAAIVPNAPMKILIAGLVAASMNPAAMLIARARGTWEFGSATNVILMHYPDFLLVGVAVVISQVVTRLGQQVMRAREMGSYELGELLGRGGMGEVYRATHRMLARPAAIKLIRPEMLSGADEDAQLALRRFRREAEAAANLRSPHTVEIYDFGVTDDGTLYFVMELLDGLDLETLVRRHGPLPASRVVHIVQQVCDSLEEAHANGLVHRDIKPANIHVGRVGLQEDFVKVLDFGLVKPTAVTLGDNSLATAAGLTPGTPAYMAPEVALGEHADGRADLYALGCVAYYLLTGRLVFEAENVFQVVVKHLQDEPEPPSRRTDQSVPASLDAVVLACLVKQRETRMRSAGDLRRALAGAGLPAWRGDQAAQWWTMANGGLGPTNGVSASGHPAPA
jgi:tRNA A-37 threonylcarbamoyl transferase component Bud32